jgi:ribosome biogenesis GTPase
MHFMLSGGILLDLPGMRELKIADCEQGVKETFNDISDLQQLCRFSDCQHQDEPGCAIQAAILSGKLESRRLASFNKLMQEQAFNSASLAEKRANDRSKTRYYRSVSSHAKQRKKGWS